MKFGIIQGRLTQSKELQSFPEDWAAEFRIAKEIGIDFIELIVERTHNPKNPVWVAKSDFPFSCPIICDDHIISNGIDIDYTRHLIDQCHWFGCSKIVMPLFEAAKTLPPDKISQIRDYATLKGVSVIFESNANDGLYPITYDTGNRAWAGFNNRDDILTFNEKISHVHIKDKNTDGVNVFLGTGLVDFYEVARALKSIGYDGTMTFESVRGHDPVKTAKHNIEFIRFFINECK